MIVHRLVCNDWSQSCDGVSWLRPAIISSNMCMLAIGAFQLRVQNATINISGNQAVHKARKANFFDTFLILFSQNQSSPLNTSAVLFINLNRPAKLKHTWFRFH